MTDCLQRFFRLVFREIPCRKRAGSCASVYPGNRLTTSSKLPATLPTPRIEEVK